MCNTSPGAAPEEDLAVHSPRGEFCQWQPREPVLELCFNVCLCKCDEWCGSASQGAERSWETECSRKETLSLYALGFFIVVVRVFYLFISSE